MGARKQTPVVGRAIGLVIAGGLVIVGAVAVLILVDLRSDDVAGGSSPIVTVRHDVSQPELPRVTTDQAKPSTEIPTGVAPWESTPQNTKSIPPGHIPAWKVKPPPPLNVTAPTPVPPPDPATHRPPMHNPGGVNGDRPPRPGLP